MRIRVLIIDGDGVFKRRYFPTGCDDEVEGSRACPQFDTGEIPGRCGWD